MKRLAFVWHLPLLIRELTELAARRRTYNVRLAWAVVLFAATFLLLYSNVLSTDGANALGQGRPVFLRLVTMQLWAVYLLMPAMVCGVISGEKERNSLSLLMLTTLNPWQIVIQKLFSRLIPMVSLLFISFPLMAIAFGHGGVTSSLLWSGILLLLLACLQVGSFAVMCSAFFRTTYEAFVASYLLFLLLCWMMPPLFAPHVFETMAVSQTGEASGMTVLIVVSIAVFLAMARVLLESRAFVPPRNYVLEVFQALDRMYLDMNKATGGIVLVRDHHLLPDRTPVAWRETSKKSMGTVRYLFRILVVLELPLLVVFQLLNGPVRTGSTETVTMLLYWLWVIAVALVAVHAASLVSSERSRQTLDVLLTTPIPGRSILLQKFRGVRRLMAVLCVPFLSIFVFERWYNSGYEWEYVGWSAACVLVYLPLAAWFSVWLSLKIRSQARAIVSTLCVLAVWVVLTASLLPWLAAWGDPEQALAIQSLSAVSPAVMIRAVETASPSSYGIPEPHRAYYLASLMFSAGLAILFRWLSLRHVDARLGRANPMRRRTKFSPPS